MFAANAFSLLGLRQLFFLIDGLLDRLVYLAYGLAVILGFIGAKLVIHALHTNELPFINGGEHVTAIPEISTAVSLAVIVVTLLVTTVASLARGRTAAGRADVADARRRPQPTTLPTPPARRQPWICPPGSRSRPSWGSPSCCSADLAIVARRPHEPSVKEATLWVSFYVTLALLFGLVDPRR